MNPQTESVKAEFEQTGGRLLKNLAETPDDKLHWSPAPTARTPLELAFHCAEIVAVLHAGLSGVGELPPGGPPAIDAYCREQEKREQRTRDQVVKKFEENAAAYVAWLEGLSEEDLAGIWQSPFGPFPVSAGITFPALHTGGHIAQLEYIQTIYGDRVWH